MRIERSWTRFAAKGCIKRERSIGLMSCPHWTVVCQYDKGDEARVPALACSTPPAGRQRWTMMELERAARQEPGMAKVSRETVRRMLKKIYLKPWRKLMWCID